MEKSNLKFFCWTLMSFFFGGTVTTCAQCLPSMGTAANFAIYTASGAISNLTASSITGNIATNAGAITGFESSTVIGNFSIANTVSQTASADLAAAYVAYQNLTPTITYHTPSFGSGETITPGVYKITAAGSIAGTLTLDAQNNPDAKFILIFNGAFTAGAGSTMVLTNGAKANNIYWIIGGAFSLAANSTFSGTIIADGAISIGAGAHLNCKLLSIGGAISTYGTVLTNEGIDNSYNKYYADADADGYGNPNISSCYMVAGYILNNTDCNDANAAIHPNAVEIYGNGIDDNCNGIIDIDAVSCSFNTTWNGTSWSNGTPDNTKAVFFNSNYTITSNFDACSMHIANNATVTLQTRKNIKLFGAITVETGSSFIMNNNTNLIQLDPTAVNVGNIVVNRNTSTIIRLDHTLWSSPVTGQNIYNFSPETLSYRIYTYDTLTNTYISSTLNATSQFTPTKGIAVRAPNNQSSTNPAEWTGTFTGVPNNGTTSFNLVYSTSYNYNLVGNPFPSAINAEAFLNANSDVIEGTLYFYQHTLTMDASGLFQTGTNYASFTAVGGTPATEVAVEHVNYHTPAATPDEIIQLGQGFFVKAKQAGVLNFTNAIRTTDDNFQFYKTTTTPEKHRMWLNLKSDTGTDINQILVGYLDGATPGVDSKYDGMSYGNSGSYLYSVINEGSYVIQGRALPFNTNDEVALGFNCAAQGNYSIQLTDMDGLFLGNQDVFIRDNLTGTDTNIKLAPYTFTSATGIFNNRFKIVYTQALGVPSSIFNKDSVIVYKNSDWFHISTKGIVMKDLLVYDVSGRLIYKLNNINNTTVELQNLIAIKQILMLKIISEENQSVTVKVIN